MNRQGANYVESVGDPMPRPWQTNRHNWGCLIVALSVFLFSGIFFWFFNRTSLEEVSISIKEQNSQNFVTGSAIALTYAHNGDFRFSENGLITFYKPKTLMERLKQKSSCQIFAVNDYEQDSIIAHDTTTTLNLNAYEFPKHLNTNPRKAISQKKEYIRYSDLNCNIKFKSALLHPLFLKEKASKLYKQAYPDIYQFWDMKRERIKDTVIIKDTIHLYAKKTTEPARNKYISTHKSDDGRPMVTYVKHSAKTTYAFADSELKSYQLNIMKISTFLHITNRTCCNLFIKSIEFPCEENCKFILSFSSPMYFDKLSIEPDEEKPNELVFSSPEKIQALKKTGLYVYARDVSINNQEMLNFCIATFLGVLISYVIEFIKRLYTAKMDKHWGKINGNF